MILPDTVVISELRKRRPSPTLLNWLAGVRDGDLFLSVVSIGEIERGIEKKRRAEPAFADALTRWLERLPHLYEDRYCLSRRPSRVDGGCYPPGLGMMVPIF